MYYNVYLICAEFENQKLYKIGYTRRSIDKRISEIETSNGSDIYLIDSFRSKWGTKIEARLHRIFENKKVNREWFNLSKEEVESFKTLCEKSHKIFESIITNNTYYLEKGRFY